MLPNTAFCINYFFDSAVGVIVSCARGGPRVPPFWVEFYIIDDDDDDVVVVVVYQPGPEVISLNMTPVMLIYSSLFARWAYVVQPRNLLLMW